jgi:hypothetical protein
MKGTTNDAPGWGGATDSCRNVEGHEFTRAAKLETIAAL